MYTLRKQKICNSFYYNIHFIAANSQNLLSLSVYCYRKIKEYQSETLRTIYGYSLQDYVGTIYIKCTKGAYPAADIIWIKTYIKSLYQQQNIRYLLSYKKKALLAKKRPLWSKWLVGAGSELKDKLYILSAVKKRQIIKTLLVELSS